MNIVENNVPHAKRPKGLTDRILGLTESEIFYIWSKTCPKVVIKIAEKIKKIFF
jgi:hypothetical protein